MKTNVVFYFRYSSTQQDSGFSIEAQRRACTEFAEKNNYNVVREYTDRALTGTSDDRPAFMEMISDSKKKQFSLCIVHKMDRFSRDLFQSLYYTNKLKDNNVEVISVAENYDTTTPEGVLLRNMIGTISDYFSKNLSREVTKGMRENGHKANYNGGTVCYGYSVNDENKFTINEEEAVIVRKIFELFNKAYTYKNIIEELNKLGYKTRNGETFSQRFIRSILSNPRYIGVYIWGATIRKKKNLRQKQEESKIIRVEGGMDSIISKETFEKAQKRISNYMLGITPRSGSSSLLSGLIRCCCGHKVHVNPRKIVNKTDINGKQLYIRTYRCQNKINGCKTPEIRETYIINYILEELFKILSDEKIIGNLVGILNSKFQSSLNSEKLNLKSIEAKITALDKETATLLKALSQGVAQDIILNEIQKKQEEKSKLLEQAKDIDKPKEVHTFDIDSVKRLIENSKKLILEHNVDSPELKAVFNSFVKSIIVGEKHVEIIFHVFSFFDIDSSEFDMHYTITRKNLYKNYKNYTKFSP